MAVLWNLIAVTSWMLAMCLIVWRPGVLLVAPGVAEVLAGRRGKVAAVTRPP